MALGGWVAPTFSHKSMPLCFFQLTKALVLCSHPLGKTTTLKVKDNSCYIQSFLRLFSWVQLLDLFGDATLCSSSADGFSVILRDSDILNQKNHSITRVRSHMLCPY